MTVDNGKLEAHVTLLNTITMAQVEAQLQDNSPLPSTLLLRRTNTSAPGQPALIALLPQQFSDGSGLIEHYAGTWLPVLPTS